MVTYGIDSKLRLYISYPTAETQLQYNITNKITHDQQLGRGFSAQNIG